VSSLPPAESRPRLAADLTSKAGGARGTARSSCSSSGGEDAPTPLLSCPAVTGGGAPPRGDDGGAAAPVATPSSSPSSLMAQRSESRQGAGAPTDWAAAASGGLKEERRCGATASSRGNDHASSSSNRPLFHLEVLHGGVGGRSSTARPASLPSAGAREGAECVGPAPADEGAPALLRIRRRREANAFLSCSWRRPLRGWELEKSPPWTFPVARCGWSNSSGSSSRSHQSCLPATCLASIATVWN
jgi:hypothetical protein